MTMHRRIWLIFGLLWLVMLGTILVVHGQGGDLAQLHAGVLLELLVLLLVPLLAALVLRRHRQRWIEQLVQATQRILAGELETPLPTAGGGSLATLADALARMSGELRANVAAQRQLENILGAMIDPLLLVSPSLQIQLVNPASCRLLGYAEDELRGRPMTDVFCRGEGPLEPRRIRLEEISKGHSFLDLDLSLRTRDGEQIPVQVSFSGLRDRQGELTQILLVARDLREARKLFAAEASRRELARYNARLEQQVQARTAELAQANRELEENLRKLREAQAQLVQADRLSSVGALAAGVAHETNNPLAYVLANLDYIRQELDELGPAALEGRLPSEPDVAVAVAGSGSGSGAPEGGRVLTPRGGLGGLRASGRAITRGPTPRGMQARTPTPQPPMLRAATPFPLLRANAERRGAWRRMRRITQAVDEARQGAVRVQVIMRDLKTFARGEGDSGSVVDVRPVLDSVIKMVWNEARHRAKLVREYGEVRPIRASEARLGQVFMNLLVNAAQAIPEGDTEHNEIRVVTGLRPDGQVQVEIRDTGSGIPPAVMDRIFDPFFTTKPIGLGTGLGLSICRNLVTDLGGSISVHSEVGRGTRFLLEFPPAPGSASSLELPVWRPGTYDAELRSRLGSTTQSDSQQPRRATSFPELPAAPSGDAAGLGDPARRRRGRVLIIDDEAAVARALRRHLAREHEVVVATSGSEGLKLLAAPGPGFNIVFCDLMMPDVTGMDLYEELQRTRPELTSRIVFMTGGSFTPRSRAFLTGIPNDCIEKPFDLALVRGLVQKMIAG